MDHLTRREALPSYLRIFSDGKEEIVLFTGVPFPFLNEWCYS